MYMHKVSNKQDTETFIGGVSLGLLLWMLCFNMRLFHRRSEIKLRTLMGHLEAVENVFCWHISGHAVRL